MILIFRNMTLADPLENQRESVLRSVEPWKSLSKASDPTFVRHFTRTYCCYIWYAHTAAGLIAIKMSFYVQYKHVIKANYFGMR